MYSTNVYKEKPFFVKIETTSTASILLPVGVITNAGKNETGVTVYRFSAYHVVQNFFHNIVIVHYKFFRGITIRDICQNA